MVACEYTSDYNLFAGSGIFEKVFQGWRLVLLLLVVLLGIVVVSYLAAQRITGKAAEWQARIPPVPAAFTGREKEIQRIVDFLVHEDVGIVSITGGPGYGKSSVAIVSSHQLIEHGIAVCYVSLSEADTLQTFMMTLLHAFTRKTNKQTDELQIFSLVGLLKEKTVIFLDNADQLTLKQTELRQDFIKLLKRIVAESVYLHLVVVTRYRFKIISDFEEIHLDPLASSQALSLLRSLIHASKHASDEETTEEQLHMIANETGGIPLAINMVGRLVKSGALSVTELLEELSIDPVSTLSEDSFTPDEQLKRCIDLSYKYLSPVGKRCFLFAASFPGSFDRQAAKHIIANLTGDVHCLNQLVDRSLVEYSVVTKRYNVHALLCAFSRGIEVRRRLLMDYHNVYANHYIAVLRKAKSSGGNVSNLYTTLVVDYHNILQLLHILSTNLSSVARKDQMEFALETFQTMQTRFPREALLDWWTNLLKDVCLTTASDFQDLAVQSLQLSTKIAQLLSYHRKYFLARRILLSTYICINATDINLFLSFQMCEHPQLSIYTTMLQVLAHVSEKEGALRDAHMYNETIHRCLRAGKKIKAEELIPHNFCSDGIDHVREVHKKFNDFSSSLQLFDALLKCKESEAVKGTKLLEDAFERHLADVPTLPADRHAMAALLIAKRMYLVSNFNGEAKWLVRTAKYMDDQHSDAFYVYFRLTKLYWHVLNDKERALESGRATYATVMTLSDAHVPVWKASLRLADILNQINGSQEEAAHYFQQALDYLPFIVAEPDLIYEYQHFIEVNLVSLYFQLGQFSKFVQHYGQWTKLEAVETTRDARKILDLYYKALYVQHAKSNSLAIVDDSLDWKLKDLNTAWRFFSTCMHRARDSTLWYINFIFYILMALHVIVYILGPACCFSCIFNRIACKFPVFVILARILYVAVLLVFSFHYFLYVAIVKHKVCKAEHLLTLPRILRASFIQILVVFIQVCMVLTYVVNFIALCLASRQVYSLTIESYYNVSMHVFDADLYHIL